MRVFDTWEEYVVDLLQARKKEHVAKIDTGSRLDATDAGIAMLAIDTIEKQFAPAPATPEPKRKGKRAVGSGDPVVTAARPAFIPRTNDDRVLHRARTLCPQGWEDTHGKRLDQLADEALTAFLAIVVGNDMNETAFRHSVRRELVILRQRIREAESAGRSVLAKLGGTRMVA